MAEQSGPSFDRRQFLARAAKAGVSIAAAGAVAAALYDSQGPKATTVPQEQVTLPDFSVRRQPGKVISIVKGADRTETVNKAIDLLGGIERFIQKGQTVVIKPNVAFSTSPMLGATTHPDLVAAVVRLCYDRGNAKRVIVTDNPINDPASCFTWSGIGKAARLAGAEVLLPRKHLFAQTTVEGCRLIRNWPLFYGPFKKADRLIGIAPVKDHHRSKASMSMKNWYGLLGGRRNIFHQDINTIIAELAVMVRPTLVILDGTQTMITNGPTGGSLSDLKQTNTLIASCDMVAADAYGCSLLGLTPGDLPYLAKAEKAGAGRTDYQSLKPILAT